MSDVVSYTRCLIDAVMIMDIVVLMLWALSANATQDGREVTVNIKVRNNNGAKVNTFISIFVNKCYFEKNK